MLLLPLSFALYTLYVLCCYVSLMILLSLFNVRRRDVDAFMDQIKDNCYLFMKSPAEYRSEYKRSVGPLKRNPVRLRRPPVGHVTVLFYTHIRYLSALRTPCFEKDFPLTPSGELQLSSIFDAWGLETCALVRPEEDILHPRITQVRRSVVLIPTNVDILCDADGCIKVTEPSVSVSVKRQRQVRMACLAIPRGTVMLAEIVCDIVNATISVAADRCLEGIEYWSKRVPPFRSPWEV